MTVHEFPRTDELLAAHSAALPQPDQLCGPFTASVALALLLSDSAPSVTEIAVAAGSTVWPHEIPGARPPNAPVSRAGWDALTTAHDAANAGTNAAGLTAGIVTTSKGRVSVIPIPAPSDEDIHRLLRGLLESKNRFAVLANVRTGPIVESDWNVGHFVILWGFDDDSGDVALADTYAELGDPGMPSGCRLVRSADLSDAMAADGGRGLLLLVAAEVHDAARHLVDGLGLDTDPWST